mgnify:FL=1
MKTHILHELIANKPGHQEFISRFFHVSHAKCAHLNFGLYTGSDKKPLIHIGKTVDDMNILEKMFISSTVIQPEIDTRKR